MYEKKTQTIEESANWISYNLKRIADQLEQMNGFSRPSHGQNNPSPPKQNPTRNNYQNNDQNPPF